MNEVFGPDLLGGQGDQVAAAEAVRVHHQIRGGGDDVQVLMGLPDEEEDVGTPFPDAAEPLRRPGDAVADDDRLHLGVVGEPHNLADGGLHLGDELVGIGHVEDHASIFRASIAVDQALRASEGILGGGDGSRHEPDVKIGLC